MKGKTKPNWEKILGVILFLTLIASIVFAVVNLIGAPAQPEAAQEHQRLKSDYGLMLLECCLALVVMFLPSMLEKKLRLDIPDYMTVMYFIFLYCAVYLGEVRNFYFVVPHWDTMLHTFSGAMLGGLGFALVNILNRSEHIRSVQLSPGFVAFFAFCFAVACGVVWEIYEFTVDATLHLNMQKAYLETGEALLGSAALSDTMKDLIVDVLGALVMSMIGYVSLKREKK